MSSHHIITVVNEWQLIAGLLGVIALIVLVVAVAACGRRK